MKLHYFLAICACYFFVGHSNAYGFDQYPTEQEAACYHHHSGQQWNVAFEALKKAEFEGSENILDIGSRTGRIAANVAGRVPNGSIVGLETTQGMIDFAQKTYLPYYNNLSFVKEDILYFHSSCKFERIVSFNALHWFLDHAPLLAKVHSLLVDGGSILFTIPCKPFSEVAAIFNDVTSQDSWKSFFQDYYHPRRKFTADEYILLLEQTGFKDIEVNQVPMTYYFETKRALADWFAAFSPMLFSIPSEKHEKFLTDVVDRYLLSFPINKEGQIIFQQNELIIRACKI